MTALLVVAHAAPAPAPAPDEVSVGGTAASVHVGAHDARVVDVLAILARRFNLRVRGQVGDRRVSADFDGSLRRVIAYLLDGYDYIVRMRGDELEVTVLSAASSHAAPAPVYAPPTHPVAKLRRDE